MAKTTRDPMREVFGAQPLGQLKSADLRAGLARLQELGREAEAEIAAIRQQAKADMIAGVANAGDALLKPGEAMDQAQRWKLTVQTAIEATEEAADAAQRNEEDTQLRARHAALVGYLDDYQAAGVKLDKAIEALSRAYTDLCAKGLNLLRIGGLRLSGLQAQQMREDHLQHLVNLGLNARSEGVWGYDRVPPTRAYVPIKRETAAIALDLLNAFEERAEKQAGRMVAWEGQVTEDATAGA